MGQSVLSYSLGFPGEAEVSKACLPLSSVLPETCEKDRRPDSRPGHWLSWTFTRPLPVVQPFWVSG